MIYTWLLSVHIRELAITRILLVCGMNTDFNWLSCIQQIQKDLGGTPEYLEVSL